MARWAHISDIHAFLRPRRGEWNVKRALGALNWTLFRGRRHAPVYDHLHAIARRLAETAALDFLLFSGDAAQMGLAAEFDACREALAPLTDRGVPVLAVTGNHDRYGERDGGAAWRGFAEALRLDTPVDGLGVARVAGGEVLLLNQAIPANRWFHSGGRSPDGLAARLAHGWRRPLAPHGPRADAWRVALGHFPLVTPAGRRPNPRWGLHDADDWPALFAACGVSAYFCGHYHDAFARPLFPGCVQYCAGSITTASGLARTFRTAGAAVEPLDAPPPPPTEAGKTA